MCFTHRACARQDLYLFADLTFLYAEVVMSSHDLSCHVMSCHVMSCHVMSCHVMSSHVMSCHVMSSQVKSSQVKSSQVSTRFRSATEPCMEHQSNLAAATPQHAKNVIRVGAGHRDEPRGRSRALVHPGTVSTWCRSCSSVSGWSSALLPHPHHQTAPRTSTSLYARHD